MPIYDVDCYPYMHHLQMPQMPMQQLPTYEESPSAGPMPLPTPQLPLIEEESEESPLFPGHGPIPLPEEVKRYEDWERNESPSMDYMKYPTETQPVQMPQNQWGPIQPGFPHNTQSMPCGCGNQYPVAQQNPINHCHSCHQPMPYHMMPMQGHNRYGQY